MLTPAGVDSVLRLLLTSDSHVYLLEFEIGLGFIV